MTWTDIEEYVAQQAATAALLNTIKANLEYLHLSNYAEYHHPGTGGGDYTTTTDRGSDIDSTNFSLNLTTVGETALVAALFHGTFKCSSLTSSVRVNMVNADDELAFPGRNLYSNFAMETTDPIIPMGWLQFFQVPAGAHNFKAVWGIYGGGTGTLIVKSRPYMAVWEI